MHSEAGDTRGSREEEEVEKRVPGLRQRDGGHETRWTGAGQTLPLPTVRSTVVPAPEAD